MSRDVKCNGDSSHFVPFRTIYSEFLTYRADWRASDFSIQLRSLLLSNSKKWKVDRAVLLGLGRVGSPYKYSRDDHKLWRKKILCQVMMFLEVVDILETAQGKRNIKLFASDPSFEDADEEYLEQLEIFVVNKAENRVTENTFVYSPFAPYDVGLDAVSHSPELYLGCDWTMILSQQENQEQSCDVTDVQRAQCEAFVKRRIKAAFPGLENSQIRET